MTLFALLLICIFSLIAICMFFAVDFDLLGAISALICAVSFSIFCIGSLVIDTEYAYIGKKEIVQNPYGEYNQKAFFKSNGKMKFINDSLICKLDSVYIYELKTNKMIWFFEKSTNGIHQVGYIFKEGRDKYLDSIVNYPRTAEPLL